jgi:hypothetical protein
VQQSKLSTIRDANGFALTESGAVLLLQGQSSTADEWAREKIPYVQCLGINGSNKPIIDYQGMWDSFTALLALLIARAHSVANVAYLMFSFNDNSDYKENKSGAKHPFTPSSCSPSRAFYMRATISVVPGMIKVEPAIWVAPKLEPATHWLCALRSLPRRPGSQTVERSTTRTVSRLSLDCQRKPHRSTPKYLSSSRR